MSSMLGAIRPLAVVAGALIALQSSMNLDIMKLAFFAVTILALVGSVLHAWRTRGSALVEAARPWLIASMIIAGIVALSLPVALANGTAVGSWIRDAAPYVLVAAAPWLAVDLGAAVSPRAATVATAVAGSLATLSYSIKWVQTRSIADLSIDRLVLPSFTLATAFFALAVARSIWGERDRFAWAAVAAAVIGLLVQSGSRITLGLAVIPIILLIDGVRIGGRGMLRTSFVPALAPLVVMAVFVVPGALGPLTAAPAGSGQVVTPAPAGSGQVVTPAPAGSGQVVTPAPAGSGVGARFGLLGEVISGTDASMRERWTQTVSAWNIFVSSPLVGRGPGVPFRWISQNGTTAPLTVDSNGMIIAFSPDTPVSVLAKFGLFGIVIWTVLGWALVLILRRLRGQGRSRSVARSALFGLATGLLVLAPFGAQLEDKGTGLALILLLGLAFAVIRTSEQDEPGLPAEPVRLVERALVMPGEA